MTSFYLKYRPTKFKDLDVSDVRDFFLGLVASGREVPHAFLFTGPRGIGKTSAARILARAVNCKKNEKFGEPCGDCEACVSILSGSALDVLEIDAASNRGIDDVRELREKVRLAPVSLRKKVFIVDECHMLTTEASNALLKTLEEPPSNTLFILCTTELHKVLPTIVSRCTRVQFRMARPSEVIDKLKRVCQSEGLTISDASFDKIVRAGQGSFRDAVKLLEQISLLGSSPKDEEVASVLGQQDWADPVVLVKFLLNKDVKSALGEIAKLTSENVVFKLYIEKVVEMLREELLKDMGVLSGDKKLEKRDSRELIALVRAFEKALFELKETVIVQLPLELLAVEWCAGNESGLEKNVVLPEKVVEVPRPAAATVITNPVPPRASAPVKELEEPRKKVQEGSVSISEISHKWQEVLKSIRPKNHSVEAFLRSTRPLEVSGNNFVLEVFYNFHKERLEAEKSKRIIEESLEQTFGVNLKLICKLGEKAVRKVAPGVENLSGKEVDDEILKAAANIFGVDPN